MLEIQSSQFFVLNQSRIMFLFPKFRAKAVFPPSISRFILNTFNIFQCLSHLTLFHIPSYPKKGDGDNITLE
jgi:hypothetical protein